MPLLTSLSACQWTKAVREELSFFVKAARARKVRPLRQFAEEELVIPEGKHKGERFRVSNQPFAGLLLDEIDTGYWQKFRVTGCVQSGKTLMLFVLPTLYHLFEWQEPVIAGVPSISMSGDKWRKELWPAIRGNPWFKSQMLPRGKGSQGGAFELMEFANGAMLKFMGGHGGDEVRSGFTARVLVVTEADRVDAAGEASREAAPIYQMEARTASEAENARLFAECTATTENGFIWQEYSFKSSSSKIMCPCPHCHEYVCPEREHFIGWEDAENEIEAEENGTFICPNPSCSAMISDEERRQMNLDARLVHKGQRIDRDGVIHGDRPPTRTLGFRWNAFNNLFWSSAYLAKTEWEAARSRDYNSAQLKMRQWYWCLPAVADWSDDTPLTAEQVGERGFDELGRGELPPGTVHLSAGVDLRATQLHFVVIAWLADGRGHIIDFGTLPVHKKKYGERKAVRRALEVLHRAKFTKGYLDDAGRRRLPGRIFIDGNWCTGVVRAFVRARMVEGNRSYLPSFGRGQSVPGVKGGFTMPTVTSPAKPHIGEQYYIAWHSKHLLHAVFVQADHWKSRVHDGFAMDAGQPGALTLFRAESTSEQNDKRVFTRHITNEKFITELVPGVGPIKRWVNESDRANHYLDATALACPAGHLCGVKIAEEAPPQPPPAAPAVPPAPLLEDGTHYLITDRED